MTTEPVVRWAVVTGENNMMYMDDLEDCTRRRFLADYGCAPEHLMTPTGAS